MTIVGMDLTLGDFRRVERTVAISALVAQVAVPPLVAAAIVLALHPAVSVAGGLILVAACPAGPTSGVYTYLAGARTALAVALTAASCAVSIATLPILVGVGFRVLLGDAQPIEVPALLMSGQLVVLLLVPVGLGMLLRARYPAWVAARAPVLQALGLAVTLGLVVGVSYADREVLVRQAGSIAGVAALFTALTMAAGW